MIPKGEESFAGIHVIQLYGQNKGRKLPVN